MAIQSAKIQKSKSTHCVRRNFKSTQLRAKEIMEKFDQNPDKKKRILIAAYEIINHGDNLKLIKELENHGFIDEMILNVLIDWCINKIHIAQLQYLMKTFNGPDYQAMWNRKLLFVVKNKKKNMITIMHDAILKNAEVPDYSLIIDNLCNFGDECDIDWDMLRFIVKLMNDNKMQIHHSCDILSHIIVKYLIGNMSGSKLIRLSVSEFECIKYIHETLQTWEI